MKADPALTAARREIDECDRELGRLRDELERVADRRARAVVTIVQAPGSSVRRAADSLGISPTAVQKAVDRLR